MARAQIFYLCQCTIWGFQWSPSRHLRSFPPPLPQEPQSSGACDGGESQRGATLHPLLHTSQSVPLPASKQVLLLKDRWPKHWIKRRSACDTTCETPLWYICASYMFCRLYKNLPSCKILKKICRSLPKAVKVTDSHGVPVCRSTICFSLVRSTLIHFLPYLKPVKLWHTCSVLAICLLKKNMWKTIIQNSASKKKKKNI